MWMNSITPEYIQHEAARNVVKNNLSAKGTDVFIVNLLIHAEGGYIVYKVMLSDHTTFVVSDDGYEIPNAKFELPDMLNYGHHSNLTEASNIVVGKCGSTNYGPWCYRCEINQDCDIVKITNNNI